MRLIQRVIAGLILCVAVVAFAQEATAPAGTPAQPAAAPAPPALDQAPMLAQRSAAATVPGAGEGRIKLDVVVTDHAGTPVTGLELKDFILLDNNLPSKILSFRAVPGAAQKAEPPAEIILLFDTVNTTFQEIASERVEVEKFLQENGGHLAHPVSLFWLTNDGVDAQPRPSTDGNALATAASQADARLRTITRSEGFYGAVDRLEFSLRMLDVIARTETKKPDRKLLIWIGSGWPLLDSPNLEVTNKGQRQNFDQIVDLSTKLREARMAVYSVSQGMPGPNTYVYQDFLKGVKTVDKANPPNLGLKVIATQSGGRVLGPDNGLAAQIDQCVRDADASYPLSFDPPRADKPNEYHDLKVQIDKPGLTARTKTGYYNQP
jgi:VWFA-related protein